MATTSTMRHRVNLLAWPAVASLFVLTGITIALSIVSGDDSPLLTVPVIVIPITGAIILTKRPGNRTGRLMLWTGGISIAAGALEAHVRFSATREGWPPADWAAWLSSTIFWAPLKGYLILLLLLFPTGSLTSPRWRIVIVLAGLYIAASAAVTAIQPGAFEGYEDYPQLTNPLGVGALSDLKERLVWMDLLLLAAIGLSAASTVLRFRPSRGIERQQLKWFASTAGAIIVLIAPVALADPLLPGNLQTTVEVIFFFLAFIGIIIGLPVTIAVAMLRYRLFDIDRLINRTIVYALLSLGLLAIYFTIVLGLGSLVRESTGESPPVVVAASTLAVAALFRPLRSRIQDVVDRRFYRQKYDAARTLEQFSSRLRDEVDLNTLAGDLQEVVQETMQPAHVTLWLRNMQGIEALQ